MSAASIPVDLKSPGQVLRLHGLPRAAEVLLGDAEGAFDWSESGKSTFVLRAEGDENPFEAVLEFLAKAKSSAWRPIGYVDPVQQEGKDEGDEEPEDERSRRQTTIDGAGHGAAAEQFPPGEGDRKALPIQLGGATAASSSSAIGPTVRAGTTSSSTRAIGRRTGSRRRCFRACARSRRKNPIDSATSGTEGLRQLWEEERAALLEAPFDVVTPMGGSFNFDPRGAWTAIDAGYSPNDAEGRHRASPVVEFLAAWGLEHARPDRFETRKVRYAVWGMPLATDAGARRARRRLPDSCRSRTFDFELDLSGKNKVVTFAEEETQP